MILCVEHPLFSLQRTTGETKTRVYLKIRKKHCIQLSLVSFDESKADEPNAVGFDVSQ